jgi:Tfp pilus assembly protein PilV
MSAAERRGESGMTVVEVLVASLLLAVGILSTYSVLIGSRALTSTSEKLQSATHVGQKELETMQSLGWAALAHPAVPASGPAPHTVTSVSSVWQYHWKSGSYEPVAVNAAAGAVSATATPWSDGRLGGTVRRFVSLVDDPATATVNPDYKRLTVVVSVNGQDAPVKPVVISTLAVEKLGMP